jgi:hypothetical protein
LNVLFCRRQKNNFGKENAIAELDWEKKDFQHTSGGQGL